MGRAQAMLSAGLAHHEMHERLKAQGLVPEAFERQSFDQLGAMNDQQDRFGRRQVQRHVLASQATAHVVAPQIDAHCAVAAYQAHQMQAIVDP